jgi:myo-inositol catabolism protein IolC
LPVPRPVFILAFDHRAVLRALYPGVPDEQFTASKMLVLDALTLAAGRAPIDVGYLVDEEYGADAAREAKRRGITLAMPVEASRTPELVLQYGDEFAAHVQAFQPDVVKTLVFHSRSDAADRKRRQLALLHRLRTWTTEHGYPLMVEVLIPQLVARPGGYEHGSQLFDELDAAIAELQQAGIEADIWKIDGLDTPDSTARIANRCARQRRPATSIVLGSGASMKDVETWLRNAGRVPRFGGFAVGRSVWTEALGAHFAGTLSRADATEHIAANFLTLVAAYREPMEDAVR